MSKKKKAIEEFFIAYEGHFNEALANNGENAGEEFGKSFTDCFVESTPAGANCMERAKLVSKVHEGLDFYKSIGAKSMAIVSKDISMLDDFHAMAKVYWRYEYDKDSRSGAIDFHVVYFLTMAGDDPRIFAYVAGDEQRVLKEKGLIAESEFADAES